MRKKLPKFGDRRIIKKFLWFPKTIGREIRWFETVWIRQIYRREIGAIWDSEYWMDHEFIDDIEKQ